MMKTNHFLLYISILFTFTFTNAQECTTNLSLFNDSAKAKIYDDAYPRFLSLIKDCPKVSIALYQRGEKMLEGMIKKAKEEKNKEKQQELSSLLLNSLKLRMQYFPEKSPLGKMNVEMGKTMYDNNIGTQQEQFNLFNEAWEKDSANFKSPKGLYIYFLLFDKLVDSGQKQLNDLFMMYDKIIGQIEKMENEQALIASPLMEKKENQETLTPDEARKFKNSGIYLRNYAKIKKGINKVLGDKADCENLIPMYNKDFEEKKTDKQWLKVAASRMSAKDCTEDWLFIKLVEALHELEPSAKTAFYLGRLSYASKDFEKALEYFKNAAELEEDNLDKAKVYYQIAGLYKKKGAYSSARKFYNEALKYKPSMGDAYLSIANMIAKSANDCGGTTFEKRAVYWKAANMARKAASVDASIKSRAMETAKSFEGRAPSTADIFQEGMQGKTINLGCWVGGSVKVPNIQ